MTISNKLNLPLLYISTAGIFDGLKDYYDESDTPKPMGIYAQSKYDAEKFVMENSKQFLIRSAIEYKFSKRFKVHIGFASVDKQPVDKTAIEDFEIQRWFYNEYQFTFGSADKLQLKARFRHERRWITFSWSCI